MPTLMFTSNVAYPTALVAPLGGGGAMRVGLHLGACPWKLDLSSGAHLRGTVSPTPCSTAMQIAAQPSLAWDGSACCATDGVNYRELKWIELIRTCCCSTAVESPRNLGYSGTSIEVSISDARVRATRAD